MARFTARRVGDASLKGLDPIFQRILAARGVQSLADTEYKLTRLLPPSSIRNLETAAELLSSFVQDNKQILIFGDYDADGATSTAVCVKALGMMGHQRVDYLMPDRFIDGYGLSLSAAERIVLLKPNCVITVDNGIASHDGVALLRAQDIDVIVTDHHLPADQLPKASVIVNQNAWPDITEGKNLAGVGIAFYLMLALRGALRKSNWFGPHRQEPNLGDCLDLVAIGTVADLVPLDHLNRILVQQGLQRIQAGACSAGVRALIDIAGKHLDNFSSTDISFALAPRINAAGRLDDMTIGVQCLLSEDSASATALANELNDINQVRKDIQQQMATEATQQMALIDQAALSQLQAIVLYQPDWHEGIVGIVASKLKEKYHRPSIVFTRSETGDLKGSGRSIAGVHLRDILDLVDKRLPNTLLKFGGHAMAAGLTLREDGLDNFTDCLRSVIAETVDEACFSVDIEHDGQLEVAHLDLKFAQALQNLSPWGQRFPAPSFVGEFDVLSQRVLGGKHLKLLLKPSNGDSIDAIAFFQPRDKLEQGWRRIKIHYELSVNRFRGSDSVQLLIRDIV